MMLRTIPLQLRPIVRTLVGATPASPGHGNSLTFERLADTPVCCSASGVVTARNFTMLQAALSWCVRRKAFLAGLSLGVCLSTSAAQVMVQGEAGEETNPNQRIGFTVRKADDKFTNAVDDFERYRDKKEWEKAFRSLANITSVDPKVMAPAK